jgi:Fic family protein
MTPRETFRRLDAALGAERVRLRSLAVDAVERDRSALYYEEIFTSTRLAGATLTLDEVQVLAERDLVPAARQLGDCVMVADYASAARLIRELPTPRRGLPLLRADEIVALNARATRRSPDSRPGKWRDHNVPAFPGGMVAPPPWLIPSQVAAFVDRYAAGLPVGASPVAWVAQSHERFERIHPFSAANGRTGRLLANLLLRRLGLPSLIVPARRSASYVAALRSADSRDSWPLAILFARSLLDALLKLSAAGVGAELQPVADFAEGRARAALYKAAQRGRLRTLRRGGKLCTTRAWVADYRATRARAGRPARVG